MLPEPERLSRNDWNAAVGWGLLAVVLVLLVRPFVEMGVHDETSFVNLAFRTSEAWRLSYDNFTLPIAGVQSYWSALFVRLFGRSFTVVRLSLLPFCFGVVMLQYLLGRRLGLKPAAAALGTLCLVLCPLFLPLASTAMSDIPTLFLSQLSVILALEAALALRERSFAFWLAGAALVGFLAGANRQVFWGLPVLAIPAAAFYRWRRWRSWKLAAGLWLMLLLAIALLIRWHASQPHVITDVRGGALRPLGELLERAARQPARALRDSSRLALTLSLLCLPVLLPGLGTYFRGGRDSALAWAALALLLLALAWQPELWTPPWMSDMLTEYGALPPGAELLGEKPVVVPPGLRKVLTALTLAAVAGWSVRAARAFRNRAAAEREGVLPRYCWIVLPFVFGYFAILVLRSSLGLVFDRYLLPVASILVPLLIGAAPPEAFGRWRLAGWLMLPLFGFYAMAFSHDQYSLARARLEAGRRLADHGIPRTCIGGGYEYDAWTQLRVGGYFGPAPKRSQVDYWFWRATPSIWPRYIVSAAPLEALAESGISPVSYRTWFLPSERSLRILLDPTVPCPGRE